MTGQRPFTDLTRGFRPECKAPIADKVRTLKAPEKATRFNVFSGLGKTMAETFGEETMSYTKTILCLANSRKHSGRCIVGKERHGRAFDGWVRPVSARPSEEISEGERRYQNGLSPQILDVISVPMKRPKPNSYQTENHLIDDRYYWEKVDTGRWKDVIAALDKLNGPLWQNGSSSGGYSNNRVPEQQVQAFDHSLVLIRPKTLEISVGRKGGAFADAHKRLVKASFSYAGFDYRLAVTDPTIERSLLLGPDRTEDMTGAAICVSLGELHRGHAYKLVAAVIVPS